jgi:hyperosmotically inducible periplasmic protein
MALAADREPSDTYKVGIEISFESEFDPVVEWPSGAFDHAALDQPTHRPVKASRSTKLKLKSLTILAAVTAASLAVLPMKQAFCQDSVAGQEMHKSGQDLKSAASATGESAEHAFHGTADQMRDATLTTKVKSTLLRNERTRKYSIHVESDHGNVTIDGTVGSRSKAKYVASVIASVSGVRSVQNKLTWPTS